MNTPQHVLKRIFVSSALIMVQTLASAHAQEVGSGDKSELSLSGTLRVSASAYRHRGADTLNTNQYPSGFSRIAFMPNLKYGSVSLPFRFAVSVGNTSTSGRTEPGSTFLSTLTNPANSIGLEPKFGKTTVHLGSHVPELSTLLGSRVHIFGAGVEHSGSNLQAKLSGGVSQRKAFVYAADDMGEATQIGVRYNRTLFAGRLAWKDTNLSLGLNALYASDVFDLSGGAIPGQRYKVFAIESDPNRDGGPTWTVDWTRQQILGNTLDLGDDVLVFTGPNNATIVSRNPTVELVCVSNITIAGPPSPEENLVASVNTAFRVGKKVSVEAEFGASVFTHSTESKVVANDSISGPTDITTPIFSLVPHRFTTQFDGAASVKAILEQRTWELELEGNYIGPGYKSVGLPYQNTDYLRLALAPRVTLVQAGLKLNGSLEWQKDNSTGLDTITRNSWYAYVKSTLRVNENFELGADYSNLFQHETGRQEPMAQNSSNFQHLRLTPQIQFPTEHALHSLSPYAELRWDRYSWEFDPAQLNLGPTSQTSLVVSSAYALHHTNPNVPLRVDAGATFMKTWYNRKESGIENSESSGRLGIGYAFFDKRVRTDVFATFARFGRSGNTSTKRLDLGGRVHWSATRRLLFVLSLKTNNSSTDGGSPELNQSYGNTYASLSTEWRW